jgi:hypothetical protein
VAGFALSIYRSMLNTAPEYLREVNFCRQRLGEVLAALEQAVAAEADRRTPLGPSLEVYPGGARTLDEAAGQLIALLTPEDLLDLDGRVQQQVRRQFRAVVNYCLESNGPTGPLVELLTQQAEEFLTAKLGEAGSADVFFQHFAADPQAAQRAIAQAYQEAEPELAAARAGRGAELTVLAVPAGTAGDHLRVLAEQTLAGVTLRPAHSPDDVVFYRELHGLALTDLPQLGPQARDAYQQALETDHPPHSRKDVVWQLPVRNSTA